MSKHEVFIFSGVLFMRHNKHYKHHEKIKLQEGVVVGC